MCKEKRPLSTVNFLGNALSLNPTASTPNPEANQTDNGRTPEEISIFDYIFLPILMRNGIPITDQEREEMEFRGLPSISEAYLTMLRENQARQHYEQSREMQLAPRPVQWLLDEDMRFQEPEEYINVGDLPLDPPNRESDFPILPFETRSPRPEEVRPATPNQQQELGDTVQTVGTDDARFGDELWDTVQTVSSDDARFGDERYQSLRSSSRGSEREEGEVE